MVRTNVLNEDAGKRVVNARGKQVGVVSEVRNGSAFVDPDSSISDAIRSRLGWGDADQDDYELELNRIARITDDEIQLKK